MELQRPWPGWRVRVGFNGTTKLKGTVKIGGGIDHDLFFPEG